MVFGPARGEMHVWQAATAVFFVYVAVVAVLLPGVTAARRGLALAGASAGVIAAMATSLAPEPLLNDWIVPPLVLLVAYWTSGLLFVAPMPRPERVLLRIDRVLAVPRIAAATPRLLAEFLELAYAAVYVVVPASLVVHLTVLDAPDAGRFWAVILITDYICFGMLPWVQTRPPRTLEGQAPWPAGFRAFNLHMLGRTSIHANTFPSGHAAEALAAALLVAGAPAPVVGSMLFTALAISAGAVLGRYHYAADAVAGWMVAIAVWLAVM